MKLHTLDHSPFAARIRMQIRHKNLDITCCPPLHTTRTPEFRAAYPLSKVPTLELEDGRMIGESTAIMSYLEAMFPTPAMQPDEPFMLAQNEMLIRCIDNHLAPALSPLFQVFFATLSGQATDDVTAEQLDMLHSELAKLDAFLAAFAKHHADTDQERNLLTGDLCVASNLHYVKELGDFVGTENILANYSNIAQWQDWVQQFQAVTLSVTEMDTTLRALLAKSS